MQGLTPPVIARAGVRTLKHNIYLSGENDGLSERVREKVACLCSVDRDEIAFTGSTTQGLNIVASAIKYEPGDNVVVAACEHPSNIYPWTNLRRLGVEVRLVPAVDGIIDPEEFKQYVDSRTRVIAASMVTFYPGGVTDAVSMSRLAHSVGALFVVDAAQAVGFMPVLPRDLGVDILVAPSYKGLMSGHGGGFIFIRKDIFRELVPSHLYIRGAKGDHGIWGGLTSPDYGLSDKATLFEVNSVPEVVLAQMDKALDLLLELGVQTIAVHAQSLAGKLRQGLREQGWDVEEAGESHIACIRHNHAPQLEKALAAKNIFCSARRYGLRFGLYAYNSSADIERTLFAMKELKKP